MDNSCRGITVPHQTKGQTVKRSVWLPLLLGVGVVAGCQSVPQPKSPQVALTPAFQNAPDATAQPLDPQWWQQFGDARLTELVVLAAQNNQDIAIAALRLRQAQAGLSATQAQRLPSVAAVGSLSKSQSDLPAAVKQGQPDTTARRAALNLNWDLDVFGANRAARDAANFDAQAAELGVAGVQLWVVSDVVRQYILWQSTAERLRLLTSLRDIQQQTLRLTERRYQEGLASQFELSLAQAEVSQLTAQLPMLSSLLQVTANRLSILTGQNPSLMTVQLQARPVDQWPQQLTVHAGQPVTLLQRRPDVQAAERQLRAASATLAAAQADRFPRLMLSAVWGQQKLTLNGLGLAASPYSNAALAFSQPLLNRRAIHANIVAKTAAEQIALLNYEKAILTALEQVENSLAAQHHEQQRLTQLQHTVQTRQQSRRHAESLYREGLTGLLPLLDVQRSVVAAELSSLESHSQRWLNAVNLYQALGGGWQLPEPNLRDQPSTHPTLSQPVAPQSSATRSVLGAP
ncbi:MAG: efflux transporter outer membrane subunit [Pseudomonadota bacterium]|nr:efflux transporter outer membrane subunit [Pseudomonadota bacterium]